MGGGLMRMRSIVKAALASSSPGMENALLPREGLRQTTIECLFIRAGFGFCVRHGRHGCAMDHPDYQGATCAALCAGRLRGAGMNCKEL